MLKKDPTALADAVANSSWLVSMLGSSGSRSVRATAADSRNAITAIASAPGTRAPTSTSDGKCGTGTVCGTGGMSATPTLGSHPGAASSMPTATTTRGPGTRGTKRLPR